MKKILIFTLILILSCSQAESILEKEDSESDSANSSNEPIASTNDNLKSLEERLAKLESTIENNTLALENLSKAISSSGVISVENNSPLVVEIDKSDEEDYGKSPNNPVKSGKPMKINLLNDWLLSFGEEKTSNTIYADTNATIEFEGMDEITIDADKYRSTLPLVFGNSGWIPDSGIVKLPDTFNRFNNLQNLMKNDNILEFTHTIDYDPLKDDFMKKNFHGQTVEFEYIFK
tara:strand:+ start:1067 stop:1765 length:699 start_codon:yes stop_codon:yes gene_type:complete